MRLHQPHYFGMTMIQISSLAAIGLLDVIVLIAGAMVVMGSQASFEMPTVAQRLPTPLPQPTVTPSPTAMPRPTSTPVPDWEMFVGGGAELWLPASYAGGDPATELGTINAGLESAGTHFAQIVESEQHLSQAGYALFAFDTQGGDTDSPTTVQVSRELLTSNPAMTLDESLNKLIQALPPDTRLVDRRIEVMDEVEVGRLFVEYKFTELGLDLFRKRAVYVLRTRNTLWVVQYVTERDDFQERLPIFDLSIRTFKAH